MNFRFKIVTTPLFKRNLKKILRKNIQLYELVDEAILILEIDPYNLSRAHNIKKLSDTKVGDGQWRIRVNDYRLRYDVSDKDVILRNFKHRKDAY